MSALTPRQAAELVLGFGVILMTRSVWGAVEGGTWSRADLIQMVIGGALLIGGGVWRWRVLGRGLPSK